MKNIIFSMVPLIAFGLSGCVNPEVVSSNTVNDQNLSCSDIASQMNTLNSIRQDAEAGRSVSGRNVAAAVLFWPAVVGNAMNAKQALDAANERETVLVKLAAQKKCNLATKPVTTPSVTVKS